VSKLAMGFSDLIANNVLVKLLRGDNSRYELIASMVGTRLGDRIVVVGTGDGKLLAAVGAGTGLTGRVCAVEADQAAATAVNAAATAGGVLVEVEAALFDRLPYDDASFDVAVMRGIGSGVSASLTEVLRVLRPGGRCLIVSSSKDHAGTGPVDALRTAGFRAARLIAERAGLAFYEAVKSGR
jgi:ubiquinone/menaquinone biosynthesis C-methylase UbiE